MHPTMEPRGLSQRTGATASVAQARILGLQAGMLHKTARLCCLSTDDRHRLFEQPRDQLIAECRLLRALAGLSPNFAHPVHQSQ